MATLTFGNEFSGGNGLGEGLTNLLLAKDIVPGEAPSYETCKQIMALHPLGAKMTDAPIELAQSQERKITVQDGPEDDLVEAFNREWKALGVDAIIFNVGRLARGYGITSVGLLCEGVPADRSINYQELWKQKLNFNVWDPLNTAGSLVLNQDPNSPDFQKVVGVSVSGKRYHRTRTVTLQNEHPLYIEWTSSAFGFTGRSVFQRTLYPLKSFIRSMVTDEMVELKAGVIVAKRASPGSIVNQAMESVAAFIRGLLKQAQTGNVIMVDREDSIESLNFTNLEGPHALCRKNILDNIATGAGMPAIILNQETFAEGFGEGTEDAKKVAQFINRLRAWLGPLYAWFDQLVMWRAWTPALYETIQRKYPDQYGRMAYRQAMYRWMNSFQAIWPNFLEEPESEKIKVDDVKLKAVIAAFEVLAPELQDPASKVQLIQWVCDCFNERKELFPSPLDLDTDALQEALEDQADKNDQIGEQQLTEPKPNPPFSPRDSQELRDERGQRVASALANLTQAVHALPDLRALADEKRQARRAA